MSQAVRPGQAGRGHYERRSYRVRFHGGSGFELAGIIDRPWQPGDIDRSEEFEPTAGPMNPTADSHSGGALLPYPVAVFSHCFTCNKDLKAITRISRRLAENGLAVLRFDMTGLGGSEGDFSHTNFSTNMADLIAAIQFAGQTLGPVTTLLGHSFGGAASLAVAAGLPTPIGDPLSDQQRQRITAVVSLAAPSDTQHLANLLSRMNPEIERQGHGDVVIGGMTWTIRREMLADFRRHTLADSLHRIRAKVLAIHSPVDQTLGHDHALRIASLIEDENGLPGCSLVTLSGADHLLVNNPADAEYVADIAAAFVKRYASSPVQ